jgi:hypothetical protein
VSGVVKKGCGVLCREVVMTLAATFSSIAAESLRVRPSGILLTSLGAAGTS